MAVCVRKLSIESFSENVGNSCSFKRPLKELHLCLLYFDLTSQKIYVTIQCPAENDLDCVILCCCRRKHKIV